MATGVQSKLGPRFFLDGVGVSLFLCLSSLVTQVETVGLANKTPQPRNVPEYLIKSEDTPTGTVLGNISAYDSDGPENLSFSIPNKLTTTSQLVELRNMRESGVKTWTMDIVLIKKLDRDFEPQERKLIFSATDGKSTIALEVLLMIQDVNDEPPLLTNLPYKVTINENQPVNSVIFPEGNISAFDPDNGRGSTIEYSLTTDAQGADEVYRSTFQISSTTGEIYLRQPLDYEKHSFYIYKVGVQDKGDPPLIGKPADFVVTVLDVQDTPPMFVNLPYSKEIKETETVGKSVLRVTGIDGDQGIPNDLSYSFVSGDHQNFAINGTTGWITVKAALDRDSASMASNGGVYAMYVEATEIDKLGQPNYGDKTARALVTISVQDVNDNDPVFSQSHYTAQLHENMQNGVPVTFLGDMMRVADKDQGTNSHFELLVEKDGQPYHDFNTLPQEVYTESTVLIRINNSEALDYEKEKEIIFQIVAREKTTTERRSSTATVTLSILDMNDNAPVFTQSQYLFNVSEDAPIDHSIGDISAVDDDTGSYADLSYSVRGGRGKFRVDPLTGTLYVQKPLDRETTSEYYLSAEAIDGGGLRAPTEIRIIVTDVNDNPPLFKRSDYTGVVREKDPTFLRPIIVEAVDDDEPSVANIVHYRIDKTPPGLESNFTINRDTGQISLEEPLDYEKLDPALKGKIVLEVVAHDSGVPERSSSVLVNITVEDINDFPPVFSPDTYEEHLVENSPEDTSVLRVSATDKDSTSPNNEFFYRIDSGALDKFRVNFSSGEIFVESGARLDREDKQMYHLRVSATDRGNSPLTGFSDVTIILDNVNDELPRFSRARDSVQLSENTDVGSSVFSYVATDTDVDSQLRYTLLKNQTKAYDVEGEAIDVVATGVDTYFGVHEHNGTIFVLSTLDRETAERVEVKLLVQDLQAVTPPVQTATATLTVSLLDYNDNPPVFDGGDQFRVNVSEAEGVNQVILRVLTSDPDRGQEVKYRLQSATSDPSGVDPFSIDESSGAVMLDQELDRELKPSHTFVIVATDTGVPPQSSTATVFIEVMDQNDNVPEFVDFPTLFEVAEDASEGHVVHTLTANDMDAGDFGKVVYSLEGVDSDTGNFEISSTEGTLTVAKQLDREVKSEYRLEVMARDSDPDVVNRKSKRVSLTIKVTDVNDNSPQFQPVGQGLPTVAEIAEVGTSIFTVSATDPDEGDNGAVQYQLTSDSNATFGGKPLFFIEKTSGVVKVAQGLHARAGDYYITVQAYDKGTERKFTDKQFVIDIIDVNDAFPVFTHPDHDNSVVQIMENATVGTLVIKLEAEDSDLGRNGIVEFTLDPQQTAKNLQTFSLNAKSGELRTKKKLDREEHSEYVLKLKATDNGVPTNFSTPWTLVVRVKDTNDQPPEFNVEMPLQLSFMENDTSQACANVSVAVDKDSEVEFTIICYYLVGVELTDVFQLDKSGTLCLKKDRVLDREVTASTNLVVRASDNCNEVVAPETMDTAAPGQPPSLYNPTQTTLMWVKVSVEDVNDFSPVFVRKDLALGITRDVQVGKVIYDLKPEVVDNDTARWGVLTFTNLTSFKAYPDRLDRELAEMKAGSPFTLLSDGKVKVNTYFNGDMSGYFIVTIRVKDNGGLYDDAKLRISLISDGQRLKVVFRERVGQVQTYKAEFAQRMSDVTNYRIVVHKVQVHENENNVAENDKTDMFIHGEDKTTNEIIPAVTLLRTIDELSANAHMISLLNDFNILEIVETQSLTPDNEREQKLQMALILVSVILGVLCIILAVILYFTYKRYSRKLKAATALAYVNSGIGPQETDLYKVEIPGTNMHSYENSNPIYLEKIMLEGDDDGQNSLDENTVADQTVAPLDEQDVCMNILHNDATEDRNDHHHDHNHHHHRDDSDDTSNNNHHHHHHNSIHNSHHHNNNRTGYLKAALTEHDTSRNLQANNLAKGEPDDKMRLHSPRANGVTVSTTPRTSASARATATAVTNSNNYNTGSSLGRVSGRPYLSAQPARPIVINGGEGGGGSGDVDYLWDGDVFYDGTVTCSINGLPSTEI